MKKSILLLAVASVIGLTACNPAPVRTVYVEAEDRELSPREQRAAECREQGLYLEHDSWECEEFMDAYDLDEGSKKKKYKQNPQVVRETVIIKQAPATVTAAERERIRKQEATKLKLKQQREQRAVKAKAEAERKAKIQADRAKRKLEEKRRKEAAKRKAQQRKNNK